MLSNLASQVCPKRRERAENKTRQNPKTLQLWSKAKILRLAYYSVLYEFPGTVILYIQGLVAFEPS